MKVFQGNHFEIGAQIGRYYTEQGVEFSPVTAPDLLQAQLEYYQVVAPEIIEELHGIAAGGSFAFDEVAHERLVCEILYFREAAARSCSIGGFTDQAGRAWIARNMDWHSLVAEHFQAWKFILPEATVVAISDMCISSQADIDKKEQRFLYHDAINSHGVYIGLTYAHCAAVGLGLTTTDIIKLVSWRCKTVDEAVKLFATVKLCCPKNYFLGDRAGLMAVVEHAVEDLHIRYPDACGVLVLTNHYTGLSNISDLASREVTTFDRYSRLADELGGLSRSKAPVSFERLDPIMTNPDTPVCQFWPAEEIETVWTLLLDLTQQSYRLIGNPRSASRVITDFAV